jgi:hypothetical protein
VTELLSVTDTETVQNSALGKAYSFWEGKSSGCQRTTNSCHSATKENQFVDKSVDNSDNQEGNHILMTKGRKVWLGRFRRAVCAAQLLELQGRRSYMARKLSMYRLVVARAPGSAEQWGQAVVWNARRGYRPGGTRLSCQHSGTGVAVVVTNGSCSSRLHDFRTVFWLECQKFPVAPSINSSVTGGNGSKCVSPLGLSSIFGEGWPKPPCLHGPDGSHLHEVGLRSSREELNGGEHE